MKKGDLAFFYHTGDEKQVVGVVEVIKEAYADPTDKKGVFWAVDVKALKPVPKPVTLAAVKAEPKLKDMALVKYSRLSVQPVTDAEWKIVCKMGGIKLRGKAPWHSQALTISQSCSRRSRAGWPARVWYMRSAKPWMAAIGITPNRSANAASPGAVPPFVYAFVANVVIAWVLAGCSGILAR